MPLCLCGRGEDSSACRELSNFWEELDELSVVFWWWWGGETQDEGWKLAGHAKQTAIVKGCHQWTNKNWKSDWKNRKGELCFPELI